MSKAEERALEVYPDIPLPHLGDGIVAKCGHLRRAYTEGYEQAEKDLALTPEDIKLITKIHYEIVFMNTTGIKVGDVASEILTRFKQFKEDNK